MTKSRIKRARLAAGGDEGIGLVEVVVSMLILAMVALAFLPVLTANLKLTATSASITTAAELADARISAARDLSSSCASIAGLGAVTKDAGNGLKLETTSAVSCPTGFPATVKVTATVKNLTTLKVVASVATIVRVTG